MKINELIALLSKLPPEDELIFASPDDEEGHTANGEGDHFWIALDGQEPINFGTLHEDGKRHEWIIPCTWHPLHRPSLDDA